MDDDWHVLVIKQALVRTDVMTRLYIFAGTDQVFRLNWAANGRQSGAAPTDFSLFVGDLVEEVSDYRLQEAFRRFYPSVRSAKVQLHTLQWACIHELKTCYRFQTTTSMCKLSFLVIWCVRSKFTMKERRQCCPCFPLCPQVLIYHQGFRFNACTAAVGRERRPRTISPCIQ